MKKTKGKNQNPQPKRSHSALQASYVFNFGWSKPNSKLVSSFGERLLPRPNFAQGLRSSLHNSSDPPPAIPDFTALRTIVPATCRRSLSRSRASSSSYGELLCPVCTQFQCRRRLAQQALRIHLSGCVALPTCCSRILVLPNKPTICLGSSYHRPSSSIACRRPLFHPLFLPSIAKTHAEVQCVCGTPPSSTIVDAMS